MRPRRIRTVDYCQQDGCDKVYYCKDLCVNHYNVSIRKKPRSYTRRSYENMVNRCVVPTNNRYEHYGGRGIEVCTRWLQSFDNFIEDMGYRPVGLTLDRIDTNGNYEPSNCRWADYTTQNRNHRVLSSSKSGVTGVTFETKRNKWVVGIGYNSNYKKIGYFESLSDAIKARRLAEERYWV